MTKRSKQEDQFLLEAAQALSKADKDGFSAGVVIIDFGEKTFVVAGGDFPEIMEALTQTAAIAISRNGKAPAHVLEESVQIMAHQVRCIMSKQNPDYPQYAPEDLEKFINPSMKVH